MGASSSSWRICDTSTHSCASPVAPSLMPRGLSRTTSRPSSTLRPARWTSAANASSALVLRIPCEPMKAILAGRGQVGSAAPAGAVADPDLGLRGMTQAYAANLTGGRPACAVSSLDVRGPVPGGRAAAGVGVHRGQGFPRSPRRLCATRTSPTPGRPRSAPGPLFVCVSRRSMTPRPRILACQARAAIPGTGGEARHGPRGQARAGEARHAARRRQARLVDSPARRHPSAPRESTRPRREHHRGRRRGCERSCGEGLQALHRRDQVREALLGVREQHPRLGVRVELVVDARVAAAHRALHHDDVLGVIHVQDRHARHR